MKSIKPDLYPLEYASAKMEGSHENVYESCEFEFFEKPEHCQSDSDVGPIGIETFSWYQSINGAKFQLPDNDNFTTFKVECSSLP